MHKVREAFDVADKVTLFHEFKKLDMIEPIFIYNKRNKETTASMETAI